MKRKLLALFAALLALLLASCSSDSGGGSDDEIQYTEDGRPMVKLTVNIGEVSAGRALTLANAKSDTNFYEVVFFDSKGNKTYRTSNFTVTSGTNSTASLDVPVGTYTTSQAKVFAGTSGTTPHDLLAIGNISAITGGSGTTGITSTTTGVTFTLTPLTNDVSTANSSTTFHILSPPSFNTSLPTSHPIGSVSPPQAPQVFPVFSVPQAGYSDEVDDTSETDPAQLDKTKNILGHYAFKCTNGFDGVVLRAPWTVSSPAPQYTGSSNTLIGATGVTANTRLPKFTTPAASPFSGDCYFVIDVKNTPTVTDGYCMISIEVPVFAINGETGGITGGEQAVQWTIKGGKSNNTPDTGPSGSPNTGGAVLIKVGDPAEMKNITVTVPEL